MKKAIGIIILGLFLAGCETTGTGESPSGWKYPWPQGLNKNEFIDTFFKGKSLTNVEGIYSTNDNRYEFAVIKNTFGVFSGYDYLGILTDENAGMWKVGQVKMVLKKTATPNIFTGNWYMSNKSRMGRTFFLKEGYMEVQLPSGAYGINQTYLLIKAWPEAGSTQTTAKKKKKKKKTEPSSGSAFFVDNRGHIITNYHVVEKCNNKSKIFYNTNEIDAKLIAKDKLLDLALLKVEVSNNKFITISNKAPRKLQRIIAAGYPFGKYLSDDMKFTSGIVSSLKGVMDDSTRLQIDAALNPGNSGGPIVDENTGELVAVAVAGLRKDVTEAVNYGIKAGSVKNFLESNQIDPSTFSKNFSTGDIAELLESTVLYTFCN
jgi:S1-C subfamily serine protease